METIFKKYTVTDTGIEMRFKAMSPDPFSVVILITDPELAAVTTASELRTLIIAKLRRKIRAEGIASRLDALVGQAVTI